MKKEIVGTSNRVLEIDLSTERFETYNVTSEERKLYLGGKGLGLKLIYDRMKPGVDPLGEENIIAFMPGVMMGTGAPCSGRFAAITKSPLTGIMTTSSCGGPFGMQLKTAGWDGALIKGRAKKKTYVVINSSGVEFCDASKLWGMDAMSFQKKLKDKGAGVVIGYAGENLVRFANIVSGERYLGRAGMGAVMGAKNLKGVLAKGNDHKIIPVMTEAFSKARKTAKKYINANNVTSNLYRNYGTPANTVFCNEGGILPVNNFTKGKSDQALALSGQSMKESHDTKHHTCKPCTILCGKKGTFDGESLPTPEYETVSLLGSNLGVFDPVIIARWNKICGEAGMDTISAGGTIAWVMEATEKGLIESDLKFGSPGGVDEALGEIANCTGFGKEMALGTRSLSKKYGGSDFAIHVKGLEMPGYDPRGSFGQGLSYAVANKGACHLSTAVFTLEVFFKLLKPYETRAKADFVAFFENVYCCIISLHTCQFTCYAYTMESPMTKAMPDSILGMAMQNMSAIAVNFVDYSLYATFWSTITGVKMSGSQFLKAGSRIHVLERYMNTLEGISRKDDTLPDRLLKEGRECDPEKRTVPLEKMLDQYYKIRGYDSNGIPTEKTLKKLSIIPKKSISQ